MARFFVTAQQIQDRDIIIQGGDARHLAVVLRKSPGDQVVAVGPDGTEYTVRLVHVDGERCVGHIVTSAPPRREPPMAITLVQALLKGDRFEWVIQKGTEVGMGRLVPMVSARTVVRPPADRLGRRLERWQRIAEAAAQQSGRTHVPPVDPVRDVEDVAALAAACRDRGGLVVLAWEGERDRGLYDLLAGLAPGEWPAEVMLIVGPEGGFELQEVELLRGAGAQTVSLGPLIFRAETAGPALLIMVLYHAGFLGRPPGQAPPASQGPEPREP